MWAFSTGAKINITHGSIGILVIEKYEACGT
jgi:hypothetical protein